MQCLEKEVVEGEVFGKTNLENLLTRKKEALENAAISLDLKIMLELFQEDAEELGNKIIKNSALFKILVTNYRDLIELLNCFCDSSVTQKKIIARLLENTDYFQSILPLTTDLKQDGLAHFVSLFPKLAKHMSEEILIEDGKLTNFIKNIADLFAFIHAFNSIKKFDRQLVAYNLIASEGELLHKVLNNEYEQFDFNIEDVDRLPYLRAHHLCQLIASLISSLRKPIYNILETILVQPDLFELIVPYKHVAGLKCKEIFQSYFTDMRTDIEDYFYIHKSGFDVAFQESIVSNNSNMLICIRNILEKSIVKTYESAVKIGKIIEIVDALLGTKSIDITMIAVYLSHQRISLSALNCLSSLVDEYNIQKELTDITEKVWVSKLIFDEPKLFDILFKDYNSFNTTLLYFNEEPFIQTMILENCLKNENLIAFENFEVFRAENHCYHTTKSHHFISVFPKLGHQLAEQILTDKELSLLIDDHQDLYHFVLMNRSNQNLSEKILKMLLANQGRQLYKLEEIRLLQEDRSYMQTPFNMSELLPAFQDEILNAVLINPKLFYLAVPLDKKPETIKTHLTDFKIAFIDFTNLIDNFYKLYTKKIDHLLKEAIVNEDLVMLECMQRLFKNKQPKNLKPLALLNHLCKIIDQSLKENNVKNLLIIEKLSELKETFFKLSFPSLKMLSMATLMQKFKEGKDSEKFTKMKNAMIYGDMWDEFCLQEESQVDELISILKI